MLMFKRAPAVSPNSWESRSVARVSVIDKGTIAIKFQIKITSGGISDTEKMMATRVNGTESIFFDKRISLVRRLNAAMGLSQ